MREYRYTVDRDGRVFHEGSEIIDPVVLRFFLRAMQRTPDGRYLVVCQKEHNWFQTPDTPFVIQRLACVVEGGQLVSVELYLAGDHHEPLDPESVEAEGSYLYCRVRNGGFRARFGRRAVQQLAPYLDDDSGGPVLLWRGVRHAIRQAEPSRA